MIVPLIETNFSAVAWFKGDQNLHYRDRFNLLTRDWGRARAYKRGELFAVFDGIGSFADFAAVQTMAMHLRKFYTAGHLFSPDWTGVKALLEQGNKLTQDTFRGQQAGVSNGGCCGTVAYIHGKTLYLFQTGHTCAMIIRGNSPYFKTRLQGYTAEHNSEFFGKKNDLFFDYWQIDLMIGDRLLIFTKSVSDHLTDQGMVRCTQQTPACRDTASQLVFDARQSGAKDDVTVMVIDIKEIWY